MPRLRCRATTLHAGQTRPFGSESAEVCRSCLFVSINQKHVSAFPGAGNGKIDGKGGFAHSSLVSEAIMIRYLADFFPDSNQCRRAIESQPSPLQDRRRLASQKKGSAACNRRQQTAFQAENLQDPISSVVAVTRQSVKLTAWAEECFRVPIVCTGPYLQSTMSRNRRPSHKINREHGRCASS